MKILLKSWFNRFDRIICIKNNRYKKKIFKINLLSANNYNLICSQIRKYKPKFFVVTNQKVFEKFVINLEIRILRFIIILILFTKFQNDTVLQV